MQVDADDSTFVLAFTNSGYVLGSVPFDTVKKAEIPAK